MDITGLERMRRLLSWRALSTALAIVIVAGCGMVAQPSTAQSPTRSKGVLLAIASAKLPGSVGVGFGSLWVANRTDGTVSRFDTQTGRLLATIAVGQNARLRPGCEVDYDDSPMGTFLVRRCDLPSALAVGPGAVWVGRNDTLSVARIDPALNRVTATIPVGVHIFGLAASASAVWVSSYEDDRVLRIDPRTSRVSLDLPVPHGPSGIAVDGNIAWAVDYRGRSVTAIDGDASAVAWTVPIGFAPFPITIGYGSAWVRNEADATVSRIDIRTGTLIATIPVDPFSGADGIDSLAVTPAGVWLGGQRLERLDPGSNQVVATLPFQGHPVSAGDGTIWVISLGGQITHLNPAS